MKGRAISIILGAFVLACILLGGSAQGVLRNLGLELAALALLTATVAIRRDNEGGIPAAPAAILLFGLAVVAVQLIPLPPGAWTSLPGRSEISDGLAALGYPLQAMPISEAPFQSMLTVFALIPPIAVFVSVERLRPSPRVIASAIVAGMLASIFVGALQIAGGNKSGAYLYAIHNNGAVGLFANQNHMATLLLVGIPMGAALVASTKSDRQKAAKIAFGAALLVLTAIGIALNGSRAAVALSLPVAVASVSLFPALVRWRGLALGASIVALVGGVGLIMSNPINSEEFDVQGPSTQLTRGEIWKTTSQAIADSFPVGTGLGTFEQVYHSHEDPMAVGRSYVNHAHNDYLELVLELGIGGIVLILAFLAWWAVLVARIWQSPHSTAFARAATIATGAILAHSIVDFPLRTIAISSVFGACLAIMLHHLRQPVEAASGEARPTRHVRLG